MILLILRDSERRKAVKFVKFDSVDEECRYEEVEDYKLSGGPEVGDAVAIRFTNKKYETFGKVSKVGSRSASDNFDIISTDGIFKYLLVGRNIHYWRFLNPEEGEVLRVEEPDNLDETEILFPIYLTPKQQVGVPEVEQAMKEEIEKWYSYECFSVRDRVPGMKVIPLAWVVNKNCDVKSSNQNAYKARLVVRGDLELGSLRTDSPTAPREILRITLALSAILNFRISTCDISSASI